MTFGFHATVCLAIFLLFYVILLAGLFPLLNQQAPLTVPTHRGEVLSPVVANAVEKIKHLPHFAAPGQRLAENFLAENVVGSIKKKIHNLRKTEGVTDASLMQKAATEMDALRQKRQQQQQQNNSNDGGVVAGIQGGAAAVGDAAAAAAAVAIPVPPGVVVAVAQAKPAPGRRPGFMVLGMHRSGTSMLAGLMVTGMGYKTGGPLIGGAFDNGSFVLCFLVSVFFLLLVFVVCCCDFVT
jgi:hypothetical protein